MIKFKIRIQSNVNNHEQSLLNNGKLTFKRTENHKLQAKNVATVMQIKGFKTMA